MKTICANTVKCLLAALFLSYYLSATCFVHTHRFSWGAVTHSHLMKPFGDKAAGHSHTQSQCATIALLAGIVLAVVTFHVFCKTSIINTIHFPEKTAKTTVQPTVSRLRAPPCD
jgi:hypothetical protein